MDTISSRESNTNFLPMIAAAVGAIAFILAIVALVKMSGVSKDINELKGISSRVESLESQVGQIGQQADSATRNLASQTQAGFNTVATELSQAKARLEKLEAVRVAPAVHAAAGAAGARGPVVAGPGEYIVKSGDSGASIARANGVRLPDLMAVNPDVNWNKMHVGQKIKLPAKAGAQPAAQ